MLQQYKRFYKNFCYSAWIIKFHYEYSLYRIESFWGNFKRSYQFLFYLEEEKKKKYVSENSKEVSDPCDALMKEKSYSCELWKQTFPKEVYLVERYHIHKDHIESTSRKTDFKKYNWS